MAALLPLTPDEAYYWVWSRSLADGYLDHPLMIAGMIRGGTTLAGHSAFGVRLLSPFAAALGSLLVARAARDFTGEASAGRRAALLLNATLFVAVGGVTATPDTPLLLFWSLALAVLGRLLATGDRWLWPSVGATFGLAMSSKYTAALLAPGLLPWLVSRDGRRWLRKPWPYLAAWVAMAIFGPTLVWNWRHGWASFVRQGARVGDISFAMAGQHLAELFGSQAGLFTPGILLLAVAGVLRLRLRMPAHLALAGLIVIPLAVFVQHALGDRVQANWPAILAPQLAIVATMAGPWWRRWEGAAIGLGALITAAVWVQGIAAPLDLPRTLDPSLKRLAGWPGFARDVAARAPDCVAADDYGVAAQLARLLPAGIAVHGAEPRWQFFRLPHPGETACVLVRSARRGDPPDFTIWTSLQPLGEVVRRRGAVVSERYLLYKGVARPGMLTTLPRPE